MIATAFGHGRASGAAGRPRPGRRARARGFTYVGVLVLAAAMGAAATGWAQLWHVAQTQQKERELLFVGQQFRQALASWERRGQPGPRRLEDLLADPRSPALQRHLRRIYVDPITGRAEWGQVKGAGGGIVAVHSLSQAAPLKKSGFAARDRAFANAGSYSEWVFAPERGRPGDRDGAPARLPTPHDTPSRHD